MEQPKEQDACPDQGDQHRQSKTSLVLTDTQILEFEMGLRQIAQGQRDNMVVAWYISRLHNASSREQKVKAIEDLRKLIAPINQLLARLV